MYQILCFDSLFSILVVAGVPLISTTTSGLFGAMPFWCLRRVWVAGWLWVVRISFLFYRSFMLFILSGTKE